MSIKQKQVVIIEDDAVLRRGLRRFFDKERYAVIDFENGEDAAIKLLRETPDLILCDYKLPGVNGLEILQALRHEGINTPFLLMTGYFSDEVRENAIKNGATQTLEKPIDLNLLKDSCQKLFKEEDRFNFKKSNLYKQ